MPDTRHPKKLLFGWLPQKRLARGAKLRWQDKVRRDLRLCNISESSWYMEVQDRTRWRVICSAGLTQHILHLYLTNLLCVPLAIVPFEGNRIFQGILVATTTSPRR